jgi:hypothetical protein
MLDSKTAKKICDFVYQKPRTVQEIAFLLQKNWRTADSYVDKIAKEQGTLSARTFREGTRGALKIVYWNNIEKISSTEFQERLFRGIESGKTKEDFSPFDIYQYVDDKKKTAFLEVQSGENVVIEQNLASLLLSAQKQVLIFSGNLSWANIVDGKKKIIDVFAEIAKHVPIKILTKIDITSLKNVQKVLQINEKLGREAIEIRHCEQPLRALIIDDKTARLKETKKASNYKQGELDKNAYIFYNIFDEEWVDWLQKVFWNLFRTSIPSSKRLNDIAAIKNITKI